MMQANISHQALLTESEFCSAIHLPDLEVWKDRDSGPVAQHIDEHACGRCSGSGSIMQLHNAE